MTRKRRARGRQRWLIRHPVCIRIRRSDSPHGTQGNSESGETAMPRGDKSAYTDKQKRKAEHIADSYEDRGVSEKEAKSRAWATVNKESGGGERSGSGHGKPESHASSHKG